jgi:purine-binding chemotaxis protein CheW
MGVIADSVSQVLDFLENEVEAPPPFGTPLRIEFLLGMGRIGKKFCLILDIDKVLSADELLSVTDSTHPPQGATVALPLSSSARAAESGA